MRCGSAGSVTSTTTAPGPTPGRSSRKAVGSPCGPRAVRAASASSGSTRPVNSHSMAARPARSCCVGDLDACGAVGDQGRCDRHRRRAPPASRSGRPWSSRRRWPGRRWSRPPGSRRPARARAARGRRARGRHREWSRAPTLAPRRRGGRTQGPGQPRRIAGAAPLGRVGTVMEPQPIGPGTTPGPEAILPPRSPDAVPPGTMIASHYRHCFGCGSEHPAGLHMQVQAGEGLTLTASFEVGPAHQGAPGPGPRRAAHRGRRRGARGAELDADASGGHRATGDQLRATGAGGHGAGVRRADHGGLRPQGVHRRHRAARAPTGRSP